MFGFPKTTDFGKKIPKSKFYENMDISPALKKAFVERVKGIYWQNKLSVNTLNLAVGKNVQEIEIIKICLSSEEVPEDILRLMDKQIPYHILFFIEYGDKYQLWIGYKESAEGKNAFRVDGYYHTIWLAEEEIDLQISGLDMDGLYEGFVRQIAGERLAGNVKGERLSESIERDNHKIKLQKAIKTLQQRLCKEKQLNKQMALNKELKAMKRELESL